MGIKFHIPNRYDKFLSKILAKINIENYDIIVSESEVINEKGSFLFQQEKYCSNDFLSIINSGEYYTIFLNAQFVPKNTEPKIIMNYQDFMEQMCDLVIFITDCEFVQIYCKNKDIIDRIHQNAIEYGFKNIEYITEVRKSFSAYDD